MVWSALRGSEIKALFAAGVPRRVDEEVLDALLCFGYLPAPYTTFRGVRKLAAGCYLLAAWDPRRYAGVIAVAIVGRLLGATAFAIAATRDPALSGLWPLAGGDGFFGLAHLVCGWPLRR